MMFWLTERTIRKSKIWVYFFFFFALKISGGATAPPAPPLRTALLVLLVLCLPVCLGETLHDPGSLGKKPFETRDLVSYIHVLCGTIGKARAF